MEKTGAPTDSNTILTSLATSGSSTIATIPIKKHKASNLDGYIDRPLSKEQNNLANAKLLWYDLLWRSLYSSLAVEVNHPPVVLALENMTGQRGTAKNLVAVSQKAMNHMEVGDRKKFITVTTDNPTVMQSYCHKLQELFACFLHSLNTLIRVIMSFPEMKKIVTQTTCVVTFCNSSHYWGGQLNNEAKKHNINWKMKQNYESCFYALILQYSYHSSLLILICMCPDAKKKTNGLAPVTSERLLEQIVMMVKFIIDAVGNLKLCQASLGDCMLELLHCTKQMFQLACEQDYHVGFWLHAISVFNCHFHTMNTEVHSLALFLHPMSNGRSLAFIAYNQSVAPFAGGQADGLSWWQNLPVNFKIHPLKAFTVTILSIVGHAGEVEHTFSDFGTTQSARRYNLSVETFEILGKIHMNLQHHSAIKATEAGTSAHHQHTHIHTHKEVGIAVETAQDLEASFLWAPLLSAEPHDTDDLLAGSESIPPDNIAAEFVALKELKQTEEVHDIDEVEVLEGNVFDFDELDCIKQEIIL
ncbi:hypothetical protein BDR06DRAFT_978764 [Suillus hirtellus]|nr:hypothetical protein BDR06DRAFT_978764 [Suillus hirtellus]